MWWDVGYGCVTFCLLVVFAWWRDFCLPYGCAAVCWLLVLLVDCCLVLVVFVAGVGMVACVLVVFGCLRCLCLLVFLVCCL